MNQKLKIGVTGANGYVGGRIVSYLRSIGHFEVISVVRNQVDKGLIHLVGNQFYLDWNSSESITAFCKSVDVIIHCAGMNAQDCHNNPILAFQFNGLKTGELINIASQSGVKKFIYFSTAHIYASPLKGMITEKDCPQNLHPYANSHKLAEDLVRYFAEKGEMEGIVLRLSNSFGAPIRASVNCWQLIVNDLCKQSIEKQRMVLHSSGMQRRDFITLTEVSRIVEFLVQSKISRDNSIINVGGNWSPTILEMTQLIRERYKTRFKKDIEIQVPDASSTGISFPLDYKTETLNLLGYRSKQDPNKEIDDLLQFCYQNFSLVK